MFKVAAVIVIMMMKDILIGVEYISGSESSVQ